MLGALKQCRPEFWWKLGALLALRVLGAFSPLEALAGVLVGTWYFFDTGSGPKKAFYRAWRARKVVGGN